MPRIYQLTILVGRHRQLAGLPIHQPVASCEMIARFRRRQRQPGHPATMLQLRGLITRNRTDNILCDVFAHVTRRLSRRQCPDINLRPKTIALVLGRVDLAAGSWIHTTPNDELGQLSVHRTGEDDVKMYCTSNL